MRKNGREKLAFLAPNNRIYTFNAMPFGPTNAPSFYTAMMKDLKYEWDKLLVVKLLKSSTHDGKSITLTAADEIKIGRKPVI